MKKIIIILSLFIVSINQSFATEPNVSSAIVKEFELRFNRAKDVSWSVTHDFVVASFTQYGKKLSAYFNQSAQLVVVAEPITVQLLPAELFISLVENHPTHTISEVFKMKSDEGVRYYAVLETKSEKLYVNNNGNEWSIAKKIKK
jgi:hypothetical protein